MKTTWTILILVPFLLIISCEEEVPAEEMENFIYPIAIGNSWEYSYEAKLYHFEEDSSGNHIYTDTLDFHSSNIDMSISGHVQLGDSISAYLMESNDSSSTGEYLSQNYYASLDSGLFLMGHGSVSGSVSMPKQSKTQVICRGQLFSNVHDLIQIIQQQIPMSTAMQSDSIYGEGYPRKVLQYPLTVGDQWQYLPNDDPLKMHRLVEGFTSHMIGEVTFDCYQIDYIYDMDKDDQWDDDILMSDLIAEIGLIKRTVFIGRVVGADENGFPNDNYYDYRNVQELTAYSLIE